MEPARVAAWYGAWMRIADEAAAGKRGHADLAACAARLRKNDAKLEPELALWLAERGTRVRADGSYEFKHDPLHLTVGPYGYTVEAAARFWSRIACPTLLVEGEESAFRLSGAEEARRYGAFAHATKVVLPGAAHMMQRHQPAALAQLLVDFFG